MKWTPPVLWAPRTSELERCARYNNVCKVGGLSGCGVVGLWGRDDLRQTPTHLPTHVCHVADVWGEKIPTPISSNRSF